MRLRFPAWAILSAFVAASATPVLAQNRAPEKKDLGVEFMKWLNSDDKGSGTSGTPSAPSSSGDNSLSGFINGLLPGKSDRPAGTGPARITVEGTARADDANVLDVRKADGSVVKIRQWGIEAPETKQWPWGPRARGELDRLLAASGGKVKCTSDGSTTRSGILVARCYAGETDISAKLIEGGYGVEWREVSGGAYTQLESGAQSQKRGVWSGQ